MVAAAVAAVAPFGDTGSGAGANPGHAVAKARQCTTPAAGLDLVDLHGGNRSGQPRFANDQQWQFQFHPHIISDRHHQRACRNSVSAATRCPASPGAGTRAGDWRIAGRRVFHLSV